MKMVVGFVGGYALAASVSGLAGQTRADWIRPADEEAELATSAAPLAVSGEATVWVLEREGFVEAREGSNGFHCMVRRLSHPGDVIPVCFNPESARTIMPVYQELVLRVMEGETFGTAWQDAMERYEAGSLEMPEGGQAVAYMMSSATTFHSPQTGDASSYFPHFMVYAPYLTGSDIGASQGTVDGVPLPFVAFPGQPGSYLMIPTGPIGGGISPSEGLPD